MSKECDGRHLAPRSFAGNGNSLTVNPAPGYIGASAERAILTCVKHLNSSAG
jgi:hypothetical protein